MSAISSKFVSLPTLISVCISAVSQSNKIIASVFRSGNLGAIDKGNPNTNQIAGSIKPENNSDPQTIADLRSQAAIFKCIRSYYPELKLIGEEGDSVDENSDGNNSDEFKSYSTDLLNEYHEKFPDSLLSIPIEELTIWIDPLDGTREFTLEFLDGVTVLVGIARNQRAIAGIIGIPFDDNRVIWGAQQVGAFDLKSFPPLDQRSASTRRIVTTRSHFNNSMAEIINSINPTEIIRSGGAGSKTLMLLQDQADAYVFPSAGMKRWDTCACEAIVEALGGRMTDSYGENIIYDPNLVDFTNKSGVLATMKNHSEYIINKQKFNKL